MSDIALDEKLLPCPFCGGDELSHGYEAPPCKGVVQCHECDAFVTAETEADAIAAWNRRASPSQVAPANPAQVTDAQIEHMVQQFLGWRLPDTFGPDAGIRFERVSNAGTPYEYKHEPVGTNLFDYTEAKAMVQHMLEGLPTAIGAGGQAVATDAETLKARAASVLCEAGALCGWPAPNCNSREGAEALFKAGLLALSQPHPVDERVVEALRECHGLDTPDRVCFYEQDFYVLSNFSAFNLAWASHIFPTSEHCYHWLKFATLKGSPGNWTISEENEAIAKLIKTAPSAHEAFKIAKRNKHLRRPDWDEVKVEKMRMILRAKADQHEYVRRKLLATGDRELVENSWRDGFWGWGPNCDGKNMLGKLWMEVRSEIRQTLSATEGRS